MNWSNSWCFPEAQTHNAIEEWDRLRANIETDKEQATAAASSQAKHERSKHERTDTSTVVEFAAYPHSTTLIESQIATGDKHVTISMAEAQHAKATKSIMRSVLDKDRSVLLYAQLPENATDPLALSNIWKNFVTCSRMVSRAGGDVLLHLPCHSKWWE